MSKLSPLSNTKFEVNGICYIKRTANTVAVTEQALKYSGDVIIPESVTYNNVKYSVTEIDVGAFYGCSELTSIRIPDSVTEIGAYAFSDCGELSSIDVDSGNSMYCSYEGVVFSKDMKTLLICLGRKQGSFEIPDPVTKIDDCAFYGCSGLTSIRIPDSVTKIGESAFDCCSGLTSVRISDSVTEIGASAFWDCIGLTNVSIPDSVTEIGASAFWGCSGLTNVSIPDSVTEIGWWAFRECIGLTSIRIPDSVTKIGESAFRECSGLKSIYIGANVSRIGNKFSSNAFQGCKLIEDIAIAAVVPPAADEDTFDESVYAKATLRVPEASIESYKTTEPWSKFSTIKPLVKQ